MAVNAGETEEPQTFEQWREAVLAEYGTTLNMDRDQVWKYLANRPYPPKILLTGVFVALVMVLALVQTPRYFSAEVHYEKAKTLFDAGRYEQTLDELDLAKKTRLKSPSRKWSWRFEEKTTSFEMRASVTRWPTKASFACVKSPPATT